MFSPLLKTVMFLYPIAGFHEMINIYKLKVGLFTVDCAAGGCFQVSVANSHNCSLQQMGSSSSHNVLSLVKT